MNRRAFLVAAGCSLSVLACDPTNEIHIERTVSGARPVLHAYRNPDSIGGGATLSRIEVAECDSLGWIGRRVWVLEHEQTGWFDRPASPVYFPYGEDSVAGWSTTHRAEPLHQGCYAAMAEGNAIGGLSRFEVGSDGRIQVLGDSFPRRPVH